jgi:hypothetical protein
MMPPEILQSWRQTKSARDWANQWNPLTEDSQTIALAASTFSIFAATTLQNEQLKPGPKNKD